MKKITAILCLAMIFTTAAVSGSIGGAVYGEAEPSVSVGEPDEPAQTENTDVLVQAEDSNEPGQTAKSGIEADPFIIEGGIENTDFTYTSGSPSIITILTNAEMTISGNPADKAYCQILVTSTEGANITLNDVCINSNYSAIDLAGTGTVTINLKGRNTLNTQSTEYACLQKNGDSDSCKLIITGEESSSLTATANGGGGAGIGGGKGQNSGYITIKSGKVTATAVGANSGAGIGGGSGGSGTHITINGGEVKAEASGQNSGAGIGGGYGGSGTYITIDGGTVEAKGTNGAGIGGGCGGNGENIKIIGGAFITNAYSSNGGAGIGGGDGSTGIGGKGTDIEIGGDVSIINAQGLKGAGIGGGLCGNGENITISGGEIINARSVNYGGAGIGGGGLCGEGKHITITGGTVNATGGSGGAGIGGAGTGGGGGVLDGSTGLGYDIRIEGGTVTATGNGGGAGIGGGGAGGTGSDYPGAGDQIIITGGKVNAYGSNGGAGIGGGTGGNGSGIKIAGGSVTAISDKTLADDGSIITSSSGKGGAGIGGGKGGNGSDISISGGAEVYAYGAGSGAGIGGGEVVSEFDIKTGTSTIKGGEGSDIKIDNAGGTITAESYSGAGIGGGSSYSYGGSGSGITISNGTVNAKSRDGGAGIGGGGINNYSGTPSNGSGITIEGGNITATSKNGAGIGGGNFGNGSGITIKGGTIVLAESNSGAGIGGGNFGDGSGITIEGGTIESAISGTGAGIGGGYAGNGEDIKINGGVINAESINGAGIGGGMAQGSGQYKTGGDGSTITISGGDITATSGSGAGIGGGISGNGSGITITDCEKIESTSQKGGAGIGGGSRGSGTNITIEGGENITAKAQQGGAGIGGGSGGGIGTDITISGGKNITADAGSNGTNGGAGIGSGYGGSSSEMKITISGGKNITAQGGAGGAGIGYGSASSGNMTVTIEKGTVTANGGENGSGISGTNVYIGTNNTTSTSYPWVYTNKIDSANDNSGSYHGIVFDEDYKENYGTDAADDETKEIRQEHKPDVVVYGDISLAELDEAYVLKSGETLNVHTGGTLTTGDKLAIEDGAVLYLEAGAVLVSYEDIDNYKPNQQGDDRKILHEDNPKPNADGADATFCTICGSSVPHQWGEDWENNDTHHWHICISDDCSVYEKIGEECSITDISQMGGYGEHVFGQPERNAEDGKMYCICTFCGYKKAFDSVIELIKNDGEGNALAGAVFGLYSDSGCNTPVEGNVRATSDASGNVSFTEGFTLGKTYYIKEITAPDGYTVSDKIFRAAVDADGNVTYGADNSENIPVCVNEIISVPIIPDPIKIRKTDGEGTALTGAVFGLYGDLGCTEKVGGGTSIADGTVPFTADTGKAIEADKTYYIKEITAPSGYTVSDDMFRANVGADGKVTYGANNSTDIPVCVNEIIPADTSTPPDTDDDDTTTSPTSDEEDETTTTTVPTLDEDDETTTTTVPTLDEDEETTTTTAPAPEDEITTTTTPEVTTVTTVTTPEVTTAPAPVVTGGGDIPVLPNVTRPVVIVERDPDEYPDGGEDVGAGAEVRDNIVYGDGYTITAMVIVRLVLAGAALMFLLWRCTKI